MAKKFTTIPTEKQKKPKLPTAFGKPKEEHPHVTNYHLFTNIRTSVKKRRDLNVGDIWLNQVTCLKCMDTITSHNRHDYKGCSCSDCFVDGGSWYSRVLTNKGAKYEINIVKFKHLPKAE